MTRLTSSDVHISFPDPPSDEEKISNEGKVKKKWFFFFFVFFNFSSKKKSEKKKESGPQKSWDDLTTDCPIVYQQQRRHSLTDETEPISLHINRLSRTEDSRVEVLKMLLFVPTGTENFQPGWSDMSPRRGFNPPQIAAFRFQREIRPRQDIAIKLERRRPSCSSLKKKTALFSIWFQKYFESIDWRSA